MISRFFVVSMRPDDLRVLQRALYDTSRIVAAEKDIPEGLSKGRTVAVVETTDAGNSVTRVNFLAEYQRERLGSFGCFGVSEVFYDYGAAVLEAGESDAYPSRNDVAAVMTPAQHLAREFGDDETEWTV